MVKTIQAFEAEEYNGTENAIIIRIPKWSDFLAIAELNDIKTLFKTGKKEYRFFMQGAQIISYK